MRSPGRKPLRRHVAVSRAWLTFAGSTSGQFLPDADGLIYPTRLHAFYPHPCCVGAIQHWRLGLPAVVSRGRMSGMCMRLTFWHTAATLLLAFGLTGQSSSSDEQSFQQFLEWLSTRPPTSRPTDLVPPDRQELIKHGLSEQEADRHQRLVAEKPKKL